MKLRNKELDEKFEVITFGYVNSGAPNGNGGYPVEFVTIEAVDEEGDLYEFKYKNLKGLNAIWEDYKPAEPLIKDEKVRKIVRAWAKANGMHNCDHLRYDGGCQSLTDIYTRNEISFNYKFDETLDDDKEYTIDELCGEGEE